ncbi:phage antirepressor KilAC domain-containing protein [Streptococcus anginosus]|uniref:phage antirepressor KilAC domain-containing protein n=1 Tax=Streptococcus anginosus TaxID=1328 RepID=UPI001245A60F|nr:phage antirepressor KilAC domain-containing protein [Streptococcus anginosus]KAA9248022.1 phage antirepressor Ant [Streptococcus anginosus]MED5833142.1 phage antirepressor KilAC domain-containing protein [Streptococcus anginosus]MED5835096.1 phage antirepressor KilAC domain-containing protein [Streptococcus anginosus]
MKELIKIDYNSERPTVNGRELHESLQIKTAYKDWFPRMCEYGFEEGKDFCSILSESTGGRPATNHQLTIDMAKQLCMIQRTELGQMFRKYFIQIEEQWNSPEAVMARALQFANKRLVAVEKENLKLLNTVALQSQQIAEMKPKVSYYDIVLDCKDLLSMRAIAKDYGKSAQWMNNFLHDLGVQFKQSDIWLLYQKYAEEGYTSTKTHNYLGTDGANHSKVHTYWTQKGRLFIYDLMKQNGIYPLIEQEAQDE